MGQLATCSFELVARFLHAIEEAMDAVNRTGRRRGNNAWQALAGKKGTHAEAKGIAYTQKAFLASIGGVPVHCASDGLHVALQRMPQLFSRHGR